MTLVLTWSPSPPVLPFVGAIPTNKKTPRGVGGLRDEECSSRYSIMRAAVAAYIGITGLTLPKVMRGLDRVSTLWIGRSSGWNPDSTTSEGEVSLTFAMTTTLPLHPAAPAAVGFVRQLSTHGYSPALHTGTTTISYAALAARVADSASRWGQVGGGRRLVLIELTPDVDAIVDHLGALLAGHAVIVAAPGRSGQIVDVHDPDSVGGHRDGRWSVTHRRIEAAHELHPDLALLLSTSGSTGSPKLVRLSHAAVDANTDDIVSGLGIRASDVAATTLPLHYCYGLSVLHSHLAAGASIVLTDRSLVDDHLWALLESEGVTSLSTVPHSFDLIAASGHRLADLSTLRQVAQAGGGLGADRARALAEQGRRDGWELRVMYGQTEACARMAIASGADVLTHPHCSGRAVDSGAFEVLVDGRPAQVGEVGDLVFHGDNVMLGYAESPADLARGRTVPALATGDLGRLDADGRVEIVGRRSGFLKIAGLRIDTGAIERALSNAGLASWVGGSDEHVDVLVSSAGSVERNRDLEADGLSIASAASGLPAHRIHVAVTDDGLPRTDAGKIDRKAAQQVHEGLLESDNGAPTTTLDHLVDIYRTCLGRPDADVTDTFVGLHGDSLSYVEVAVHLEEAIGTLPADWPSRTLIELASLAEDDPVAAHGGRSRWACLDTTVVLRTLAITAIVAGHTKVATLLGGAHILLAVGGFNFARFAGALPTNRERTRAVAATVAKIAVPTAIWVGVVGLLAGTYSVGNLFLVNWITGPATWTSHWRLWFIEALVWILVAVTGFLALPRVQKWYAAAPFAVAATVASVGLLARLDVFDLTSPPGRGTAPAVLWLFAVGWSAALARQAWQRLLLVAIVAVGLPGFMGNSVREWTIAAGILVLIWLPNLPVPRVVVPALGVLASSSLYIYLTHFQVYRLTSMPLVNLALSFGLGIATWLVVSRVSTALGGRRARRSPAAYAMNVETNPQNPIREGHR